MRAQRQRARSSDHQSNGRQDSRSGRFDLFAARSVRALLAYAAVAVNAATILGAFVYVGNLEAWPQVKDLLQVIVPVETLLLGGVVGFFFGSECRSKPCEVQENVDSATDSRES